MPLLKSCRVQHSTSFKKSKRQKRPDKKNDRGDVPVGFEILLASNVLLFY